MHGSYVMFWIAGIIIFGVVEAATLGLITIWFALGALFAFIAALIGLSFPYQLLVFFVSSAVLMYYTRPIAKKYLKIGSTRTNADRVIGEVGIVTEKIDALKATGQVKIMGQIWSAKSFDNEDIEKDTKVQIMEISGVKLIVKKIKTTVKN